MRRRQSQLYTKQRAESEASGQQKKKNRHGNPRRTPFGDCRVSSMEEICCGHPTTVEPASQTTRGHLLMFHPEPLWCSAVCIALSIGLEGGEKGVTSRAQIRREERAKRPLRQAKRNERGKGGGGERHQRTPHGRSNQHSQRVPR